jgi:hypothetical protein
MDDDNENYYCDEEDIIGLKTFVPKKPDCKCGAYFHKNYVYKSGRKIGEVLQGYSNKHLKSEHHKRCVKKI